LHEQGPWTKAALWASLLHGLGIQQEEHEPEIINFNQVENGGNKCRKEIKAQTDKTTKVKQTVKSTIISF